MRITKWGEFGILCSIYLATVQQQDSKAVGAAEIAEALSIPLDYTHQILHRLRKGEVLTSTRGPQGGYRLARDPAAVNLREILAAAEGDTFEILCETNPVYGEACASDRPCVLKEFWVELKAAIDGVLEERTLEELLKRQKELVSGEPLVPLGTQVTSGTGTQG